MLDQPELNASQIVQDYINSEEYVSITEILDRIDQWENKGDA